MPESPDRITVALDNSNVVLAWASRQALMQRLQHVQETARIRVTCEAAGASRPIQLTGGQRTALLLILEGWSFELDGHERLPNDVLELRDALISDLHNAG